MDYKTNTKKNKEPTEIVGSFIYDSWLMDVVVKSTSQPHGQGHSPRGRAKGNPLKAGFWSDTAPVTAST